MIELIEQISDLGLTTVALGFFIVVLSLLGIKEIVTQVKTAFGWVNVSDIEKKELEERLTRMEERINKVDKRVTETSNFYDNKLEGFHEQSIDIRSNIYDTLNSFGDQFAALSENVTCIADSVHNMQEKNDASNRSRFKDRIAQSYRFYHQRKEWTHMEKEAFEDLIRSYEAAGGMNSFVHSICEPESQTWTVVDED